MMLCIAGGLFLLLIQTKAPCDEVSSYGAFYVPVTLPAPAVFSASAGRAAVLFAIHYISKSLLLVSLAFLFLSWYFYIRNKSINHKEGYYEDRGLRR